MTISLNEAISSMLLKEAVRYKDLRRVSVLVQKYFKKKTGQKVSAVPGLEAFSNKFGKKQVGLRFFIGKNSSVRLNWEGTGKPDSKTLDSMDITVIHGKVPIHVTFDKNSSLVKTLPVAASIITKEVTLSTKDQLVYVEESADKSMEWQAAVTSILSEEYLTEARAGKTILRSDVEKMIGSIKPGMKLGPFYTQYGVVARKVFDVLKVDQPDLFGKQGLAITFEGTPKKVNFDSLFQKIGAVTAEVAKGDVNETSRNTDEEDSLEANGERIVFEDQIKDLVSITKLLLSGAAYSMFVAGKGGIGKTYNIEKTLAEAGLDDGAGYFKVTGTASPVAIYRTLYDNRDGIVLFDDCDGALVDQDARNIIKAATDTKKVRKLSYMKKANWLYNPDQDGEMEDDGENYPSYFDFKGKVIFISNLSMKKLDPDGALRTRSFVVNIDPTDIELVEFMKKISGSVEIEDGLSLSDEERKQTVDIIAQGGGRKESLSIRKLVRALNIRASGVDDWERLVKFYA